MPKFATPPLPEADDRFWAEDHPDWPIRFCCGGLEFRRTRREPILYRAAGMPKGWEITVYRVEGWTARPWDYAAAVRSPLTDQACVGGTTPAAPLRRLLRQLDAKKRRLCGVTLDAASVIEKLSYGFPRP